MADNFNSNNDSNKMNKEYGKNRNEQERVGGDFSGEQSQRKGGPIEERADISSQEKAEGSRNSVSEA